MLFSERELVLEIDRLKHKNGVVKRRGKSPNRVDAFIRGLEEERNYWKAEVDTLQKMLRVRSASPTRARSPTRSIRGSPAGTPNKKVQKRSYVYSSFILFLHPFKLMG